MADGAPLPCLLERVLAETGILEMLQRMRTGRLKVTVHLNEWWSEFRNYHRKDGLIVKLNDDLMPATRIAVMARRHGRSGALGNRPRRRDGPYVPQDWDPWTGQ